VQAGSNGLPQFQIVKVMASQPIRTTRTDSFANRAETVTFQQVLQAMRNIAGQ
jgi:hypothetical protein